jgi:hypothetical protein
MRYGENFYLKRRGYNVGCDLNLYEGFGLGDHFQEL